MKFECAIGKILGFVVRFHGLWGAFDASEAQRCVAKGEGVGPLPTPNPRYQKALPSRYREGPGMFAPDGFPSGRSHRAPYRQRQPY